MAYQEAMTVLARVLWEFDVRLDVDGGSVQNKVAKGWKGYPRDRVDEYQLFDTFASWGVGPFVQFRRRSCGGGVA